LYYAGELADLLQTIPGVAGSRDWKAVAHHFWYMSK